MGIYMRTLLMLLLVIIMLLSQANANPISPNWHRLDNSGPSRQLHACAYDSERDAVVLFGGMDSFSVRYNDVWEWSGSWRRIQAEGPVGRIGPGMCYDTLHHVTLMFGGRFEDGSYADDFWSWDGTSWTRINAEGPSARGFFTFAYDPVRLKAILFGGCDGHSLFDETWEWDGVNWTLAITDGPPQRVMAGMAFNHIEGKMVLFGGCPTFDEGFLGDTWELDGSGWVEVNCENAPSPRISPLMGCVPSFDAILLFGGSDTDYGPLPNDTWHYYESWMTFGTVTHPEPRWWGTMVSRLSEGTVLVIGGAHNTGTYGDIWEYPYYSGNYVVGDVNNDGSYDGLDIIYGVNYFRGGNPPPFSMDCYGSVWYVAGDVNGSCSFNGLDITYGVRYFKGGPTTRPCPACPQ
jgi:hypothetical protein